MRGSFLALIVAVAACALLGLWARPRPPAAPPEPEVSPIVSIAPDEALKQLQGEAKAAEKPGRRETRSGENLHPELEAALLTLEAPDAPKQCSPEQAEEVEGLCVKLLDDHCPLSDHRPVDGTADEVRNHAVRILGNFTGENFGNLLVEGGEIPPSREVLDADARCVGQWRSWWRSHGRQ